MNPTAHTDTIIIGGGVAGLAAAAVLSAEGKSVVLLEGRARLGGRVETRHDPAWPVPIERGAEFIHGKPRETWDIVHAGGCCLYDVTDEHWLYEHGRLRKPEGFYEEIEKVLDAVTAAGHKTKTDISFDDMMATIGKRLKPEARKHARLFVEGFDAADAREVSCAWLAAAQKASDEIEGDRLFRVYAGYDNVVNFLSSGLDENVRIELSTVARRILWGKDGVTVEVVDGEEAVPLERRAYTAKNAIITVPVGVLQATDGMGAIIFEPALPAKKLSALALLRMGPVVKVVLRFRDAFWEKKIPELDFIHGADSLPTWWTTLPVRSPILTGWAGGPAANALSGKSTGEILSAATASLAKVLKTSRRTIEGQLMDAHVADWKTEPLTRGAYSYAAVGGVNAAKELAKSVEGILFFAGEATHEGMSGTVAGAIATGRRAGREVLRHR